MSSPSKYFRRVGCPTTDEIVMAIRDIEERLDELPNSELKGQEIREYIAEAKRIGNDCSQEVIEVRELMAELRTMIKELKDGQPKL